MFDNEAVAALVIKPSILATVPAIMQVFDLTIDLVSRERDRWGWYLPDRVPPIHLDDLVH